MLTGSVVHGRKASVVPNVSCKISCPFQQLLRHIHQEVRMLLQYIFNYIIEIYVYVRRTFKQTPVHCNEADMSNSFSNYACLEASLVCLFYSCYVSF